MNVIQTNIPEVLIIEPKLFSDRRGFLFEAFEAHRFASHGIQGPFVQDNISRSEHGVLRGLHIQNPKIQGKLITVLRGHVRDVAVDVRLGSPTFGHHVAVELEMKTAVRYGFRAASRMDLWFFRRRRICSINATIFIVRPTK